MDIYNETGMAFAPLFGGKVRFPSHSLSLIVKGTYRMTPGGEPVLLEEQPLPTGDIPYETDANAVRYPSDFSYFKPKGEVLLAGHAHAPGKKPSPKVNAGFQAGGLVKALRILGNRFQKASLLPSKASEPEPFEKMEIGYQNAFGGPTFKNNPTGTGHSKEEGKGYRLPNVEYTGTKQGRVEKEYPAGFGPIPLTWPQRMKFSGSYDKKWLSERWPWFPTDFDWSFYNAAPPDQQLDGFFRGDEPLSFENLHPDHPTYASRLPGIRVRCLLEDQEGVAEIPMNLDTLWVDMDQEIFTVLWRGVADLKNELGTEIRNVFFTTEGVKDKKASQDQLLASLKEAVTRKKEEEANAFPPIPEEPTFESLESQEWNPPALPARARRSEIQERVARKESFEGEDLTGADLYRLNLSGINFKGAILHRADLRHAILQNADFTGANLVGADLEEADASKAVFSQADFTKASLQKANFERAVLKGADLSYANLKECRLPGADATGALFAYASLNGAGFQKATLVNADLTSCQVHHTDFSGANCRDALFEKARGRNLKAVGADLTDAGMMSVNLGEADFQEIKAPGSVWENATLYQGNFSRSDLAGSEFSSTYLEEASFHGTGLEGARFVGADLNQAQLLRVNLFQGSLERANLTGAIVRESNLYEVEFLESTRTGADFQDSNLRMTKLQ